MIYEVEEDGELIELKNPPQELPENAAIIFVSRETKRIYIWLGPKAGIKKKFIVAREGSKKRLEYSYPIIHVQNDGKEEEFSRDYLMYLKGAGVASASSQVKSSPKPIKEQATRKSEPKPEPKPEPVVNQDVEIELEDLNIPVAETAEVQVVQTQANKVPKPNLPVDTSVTLPDEIDMGSIEKIVNAIKDVPGLEGHVRDYLIVDGKVGILDENADPPTYKIIEDVPSGLFEVQDLKPRVLIKNGQVMAIELWRKYA